MDIGLLKIVNFEMIWEVVARAYFACMPQSKDHQGQEVDQPKRCKAKHSENNFFNAIFIMMDIRIVDDCKIDGQPGPNDETKAICY